MRSGCSGPSSSAVDLLPSRTTNCRSPPVLLVGAASRSCSGKTSPACRAGRERTSPRAARRAIFSGGKRDRHAEDAVEDAVVAEHAPERLALAQQAHVGLAKGKHVLAQTQNAPRRSDFDRAELRLVGPLVGGQEVEDVVLAGIDAGLERRPGDRRDRRQRAAERHETALLAQAARCGSLPSASSFSVRP